jgi:glycosidase
MDDSLVRGLWISGFIENQSPVHKEGNMRSIADIDFKALTRGKSFYPSPATWAKEILYFLLVDRFSDGHLETPYNPETDYENALRDEQGRAQWEKHRNLWNGGTLKGLTGQLDYLKNLGVTAIWISPVLQQVAFQDTYHGYGTQNFLQVDSHFGSNEDFKALVQAAHDRGLYVLMDVIINHAGNVFAYEEPPQAYTGDTYPIKGFLDAHGEPTIPVGPMDYDQIPLDAGVWPKEIMTPYAFSAKGPITDWEHPEDAVEGDFYDLKNIHTGHGTTEDYVPSEAFKAIVKCYQYWIAYADVDGFRLDTVKHIHPGATRYFNQEIKEFAHSIGKHNFYIIGEITGGYEFAMDLLETTGLCAALGVNRIAATLEDVAKGYANPSDYFQDFKNSTLQGTNRYQWFRDNIITFFNDHDMVLQHDRKARFAADSETRDLLANACFLNLMTLGIPCTYYGTEQGFDGSGNEDHYIREAMFGGPYGAFRTCNRHFFNPDHPIYQDFSRIAAIRRDHPVLSLGRQFLRQLAYVGHDFVWPRKIGSDRYSGVVAWSRVLSQEEFVLAMNCHLEQDQDVAIAIDGDLHRHTRTFEYLYSTDPDLIGTTVPVDTDSDKPCIRVRVPAKGHVVLKPVSA